MSVESCMVFHMDPLATSAWTSAVVWAEARLLGLRKGMRVSDCRLCCYRENIVAGRSQEVNPGNHSLKASWRELKRTGGEELVSCHQGAICTSPADKFSEAIGGEAWSINLSFSVYLSHSIRGPCTISKPVGLTAQMYSTGFIREKMPKPHLF